MWLSFRLTGRFGRPVTFNAVVNSGAQDRWHRLHRNGLEYQRNPKTAILRTAWTLSTHDCLLLVNRLR